MIAALNFHTIWIFYRRSCVGDNFFALFLWRTNKTKGKFICEAQKYGIQMKRPRISNGITEVRIENWEHSLIFFYSFASITFFIRIIIIRIAWLSSSVYALMNKMVKMQTSDVSHELAQPFFSVINVRFYYFLARAPCCCACSSSSCGTLNATKTKIKIVEFFQIVHRRCLCKSKK